MANLFITIVPTKQKKNGQHKVRTVSYTHLDVYKRQVAGRTRNRRHNQ